MTRAIVLGLVMIAAAFTSRSYTGSAEAQSLLQNHPRVARCAERHDWQRIGQRQELVWCIAHVFNSPGTPRYAVAIGHCESGSDLQDTYAGDGYVGTFQHVTSSWDGRWRTWGRRIGVSSSDTNVLSQAVVSVRMAKAIGGWGAPGGWSCA